MDSTVLFFLSNLIREKFGKEHKISFFSSPKGGLKTEIRGGRVLNHQTLERFMGEIFSAFKKMKVADGFFLLDETVYTVIISAGGDFNSEHPIPSYVTVQSLN